MEQTDSRVVAPATTRIASNLRAEMGRRKLTGRQVAELTAWAVTTTARRINGDYAMTTDQLHHLSGSTGIPMSALLDGVESAEVAR